MCALLSLSIFRYTSCPKTCCCSPLLFTLALTLSLPLSHYPSLLALPRSPVPSLTFPSSLPPQSLNLPTLAPALPRHILRLGHVASRAMAGSRKPPTGRREDVRLREMDFPCINHARSRTSASEMAVRFMSVSLRTESTAVRQFESPESALASTPAWPRVDWGAASATNSGEVISHVECTSADCSCC